MSSTVVIKSESRASTIPPSESITSDHLTCSIAHYVESNPDFKRQCAYYEKRLNSVRTLAATQEAIEQANQCQRNQEWVKLRIDQLEGAQLELCKEHPNVHAVLQVAYPGTEWEWEPYASELSTDIRRLLSEMYEQHSHYTQLRAQQQVLLAGYIDTLTALHPRLDRINFQLTDAGHINMWLTANEAEVLRLKEGLVKTIQIHLNHTPLNKKYPEVSDDTNSNSQQHALSPHTIEAALMRVLAENKTERLLAANNATGPN